MAGSRLGPGGTALPGTGDFSGKQAPTPDSDPSPNSFWGLFLKSHKGHVRPISNGAISGSGTLVLTGSRLGGTVISADGLNNAVVEIRKNNATGDVLLDLSTKIPFVETAQILCADTSVIYYSISGTNAKAQIYEHIV